MAMRFDGRYEFERQAGSGGMAAVWRAHDEQLDRTVAVKVLGERLASDPSARARFRAEAQLAASFQHEFIVRVFDYGEEHNDGAVLPFMVMEFLEGGDLATRMRAQPPAVDEALGIIRDVVTGMGVIHDRRLRHGDIKPGNVMFDGRGQVRIVDFGISRVVGESLGADSLGMGTARYVSPEQIERLSILRSAAGSSDDLPGLDARSDVYSLGVLMFEVLTGQPPFDGRTRSELLDQHLHADPRNPCELSPEIPAGVGRVILQALSRNPAHRFADADELLQALDQHVELLGAPLAQTEELNPDLTPTEPLVGGRHDPWTAETVQLRGSVAWAAPSAPTAGRVPGVDRLVARWRRLGASRPRNQRLDPLQVGRWAEQWLAALTAGCRPDQGLYWRIPDRLVVRVPDSELEPAAGWDVLVRTVDKMAARRLRETLLGSDSGLDVTLPGLTVSLEAVPGAGALQMEAWSSGESPRTGVGSELHTLEIDAPLRLALEMKIELRRDDAWRSSGAITLRERMSFGTGLAATFTYAGPGADRIAPIAITVTFVDGPTARIRVDNPGGITFHDMPDNSLARRMQMRLWKQPVRRGELVAVSSGDRIYFPHTSDAVRLEFE